MRTIVLAVAFLGLAGCGHSPGGENPAARIGDEMVIHDSSALFVVGYSPEALSGVITPDVGVKVRWLGDDRKKAGDSLSSRVLFLDGEDKGLIGYVNPKNLRPLPTK